MGFGGGLGCETPLPLLRSAFPLMQGEVNSVSEGSGGVRCVNNVFSRIATAGQDIFLSPPIQNLFAQKSFYFQIVTL